MTALHLALGWFVVGLAVLGVWCVRTETAFPLEAGPVIVLAASWPIVLLDIVADDGAGAAL